MSTSPSSRAPPPLHDAAGGVCCWRPTESRQSKSLGRVLSEKRMTLIVDDSIDVWAEDLPNLCLTRRFVGDKLDDGLQLLSWQLGLAHRAFYQDAPPEGYSYEASMARAPPSVHKVLGETRGQLLAGCTIALTGVVTDQREEHAEFQPLCVLIRLYGGEYTLNVDAATHLVARRKEGWQRSPKINRALNRLQVRASRTLVARQLRACAPPFAYPPCLARGLRAVSCARAALRWRPRSCACRARGGIAHSRGAHRVCPPAPHHHSITSTLAPRRRSRGTKHTEQIVSGSLRPFLRASLRGLATTSGSESELRSSCAAVYGRVRGAGVSLTTTAASRAAHKFGVHEERPR